MVKMAEFNKEPFEDNLRCKIVYYSCINPNTISGLNEAWGYSSPTYLYQDKTLEKLKDNGLVEIDRRGSKNVIKSDYKKIFSEENMEDSRESINREIVREFLIHSKGFHPQHKNPAEVENLVEMGKSNLEEEQKEELAEIEFSREDYRKLKELWKNPVFREIFLSTEITARVVGDKKNRLSENPLNYLFKLTAGVISSINRARRNEPLEIPPELKHRAEKIIVPIHRKLKKRDGSEEHSEFTEKMNDVYSLFRNKFKHERFNHDFIEDFIDTALKKESDEKISSFFQKVKDKSSSLF